MKSVSIQAKPAATQSGYIVAPVAGNRILDATLLSARISGVTADDQVTFVLSGKDREITLQAQIADGYATAQLEQDSLTALGEAVGTISLYINNTVADTIRATFNIPQPEQDPYEIDGFENYYGVDTMLTKNWATNKATGSSITISLSRDYSYEGEYVMKFEYAETSDGWAGATISKEVSWEDCDALQFWTVPDGKQQKTVIQITAGGNVYEYYMNLNEDYCNAGTEPVLVTIPFALFVARDIAGNPAGGLENDKSNITSIGLWVNAIAGSAAIDADNMVKGTVYYDGITAVKSGKTAAEVKKAEQTPTEPSEPDVPVEPSTPQQPSAPGQSSGQESSSGESQNNSTAAASAAQAQLVIPESEVEKMKQTQAAYNFYIENIAVTVDAEAIASWEGEMDLNVKLRSIQNFSADFDAFYIQKNKKASVLDKAVINVALSAANAQSIAYVFGREAQNAYQLLNASPVSEIGTVTIQADTNQEYLILY